MDTKDSETLTSTLILKHQNEKLNRTRNFLLITIVLNLIILILTFIQEIVTFKDLEDYEIITLSVIIGQYIGVEFFAITLVFFLKQTVINYYLYWFVVSQVLVTALEGYQAFSGRFLVDVTEFVFRVMLLSIGLIVNLWKLWGLNLMKRKFVQFKSNSSIKLAVRDSNNYTCVLENNVLQQKESTSGYSHQSPPFF